jgi:hypothetical protein
MLFGVRKSSHFVAVVHVWSASSGRRKPRLQCAVHVEIRAGLAWGLFAIVCTFHLMRKY